jgi:hypothetical protein
MPLKFRREQESPTASSRSRQWPKSTTGALSRIPTGWTRSLPLVRRLRACGFVKFLSPFPKRLKSILQPNVDNPGRIGEERLRRVNVPSGHCENSPAFQCRVTGIQMNKSRRDGWIFKFTARRNFYGICKSSWFNRPSGAYGWGDNCPGVKTPGYYYKSLRDFWRVAMKFISTNTVRRIRCGVVSTTPEIPPETSFRDDVPPVP